MSKVVLLKVGRVAARAMRILHVCNGLQSASKGERGGAGSRFGSNVKIDRDGAEHPYPAVIVCDLEGGERLRTLDQGGGYGSPLEREPARVLADVAERSSRRRPPAMCTAWSSPGVSTTTPSRWTKPGPPRSGNGWPPPSNTLGRRWPFSGSVSV